MKIGIDIDETLAGQLNELIKFYHAKTGKLIPYEKYHTQYWPEVWGVSLEETEELDKEFKNSKFYEDIKPIELSQESVKALTKDNELFIITSRAIIFKERTEEWLTKHFSEIKYELIFAKDPHLKQETKSKAQICKEVGIKIMIDDYKTHAKECADAGVKVILLDTPWNKDFSYKNVYRVKNWKEIIEKIKELAKSD